MLLQSPDEIISAAGRHGLTLMDYRTTEEKAGLQPLDAAKFDLSPWARWIAADAVGAVYEYERQPMVHRFRQNWIGEDGYCRHLGVTNMTGIDWRQTLTPVQQPQAQGMGAAIIDTCDMGHKFYYEAGKLQRCPYCLAEGLDLARRPLAWQLAQLDADAMHDVAAQLAQADSSKALQLCAALDDAVVRGGQAQPARDDAPTAASLSPSNEYSAALQELMRAYWAFHYGVVSQAVANDMVRPENIVPVGPSILVSENGYAVAQPAHYSANADMLIVYDGSKRIVVADNDEYMLQVAAMQ